MKMKDDNCIFVNWSNGEIPNQQPCIEEKISA